MRRTAEVFNQMDKDNAKDPNQKSRGVTRSLLRPDKMNNVNVYRRKKLRVVFFMR